MRRLRRALALSLAASATVLLSSCANAEPQSGPTSFSVEPAGDDATSSASASPSATRNENDRGDLIKELGEVAAMQNPDDPDAPNIFQFKVTGINAGTCTYEFADAPAEGNHYLQVDLEVETSKEMREAFEDSGVSPASLMFHNDWRGFDSNGTTMNSIDPGATQMCLDEIDQIPYEIGSAEKALGSVIIEVSDTKGEIAHRPWFMDGTGWTWEFDITDEV